MKYFFYLFIFASTSFAHDAIELRDKALHQLKNFKPQTILQDFSEHPAEASLNLEKNPDSDALKQLGQNHAYQNENARFIVETSRKNANIKANENAREIEAAGAYIGGAEDNIFPNCHWERKPCDEVTETKTCEEKTNYLQRVCEKRVNPRIQSFEHPERIRALNTNIMHDLTKCSELKHEWICSKDNAASKLFGLHPNCHHLELKAITTGTYGPKGLMVELIKKPTCQDPTFILEPLQNKRRVVVSLKLKEYVLEASQVSHDSCDFLKTEACFFQSGEPCLDKGETKLIDGFPLTRACWGESSTYQCIQGKESSCEEFLTEDCSNTESKCLSEFNGACDDILRTFRCTKRTCYPDKKVCSGEILCADGSCDESKSEESHDLDRGISRLGALSGAAEEVAIHQAQNHSATLFSGEKFECESYPIGLRDCCTDSGFLDGLIHCPQELKNFQKAKLEGRVALVGHYQDRFYETTKFVYCVFPSKLAGIVQIQGRKGQLGILFGEAKNPNCRGISPNELERINFSTLDLSPIVHDLKSKIELQDSKELAERAENRALEREQQGVAHD